MLIASLTQLHVSVCNKLEEVKIFRLMILSELNGVFDCVILITVALKPTLVFYSDVHT